MSSEQTPPDIAAAGDVPTLNKPASILTLMILFNVLTWIAVALRVWSRIKPVKALYWDDLFVVLTSISTTIGTANACVEVRYGLGQHWKTLSTDEWEPYLFWTWLANPFLALSLTLVKLSVLFQYMRLCSGSSFRVFRNVCVGLMVVVSAWGIAYICLMIFACDPIRAFWTADGPRKCIFFGSDNPDEKIRAYLSHTASNMVLDAMIFCLPLHIFYKMQLEKKSKWGFAGIFLSGSIIVVIAIVRFANLLKHELGLTSAHFDVTYYATAAVVLSALEAAVATVAASIPVFWPLVISLKSNVILIISEVSVTHEKRADSTTGLRNSDWQPLEDFSTKGKDEDLESVHSKKDYKAPRPSTGAIPRNLVFPETKLDDEPRLNQTETTVVAGDLKR
ncbi:hypothetical protein EJ05DRAFT_503633 [Pseudovirgaria hyperparasitica]|uniref:Rhodopsin domain-containing protein n=1 Tax=Pseudovirgaria hyperparasitica TaxID=470096 RepID=A0A6A6W0T0_9PEZI|nr:uncharacterized protein EJ05DRAFT_503633 [Pseudovirgaria hyperparasitica]KAF2754681.1 hypothetical protein EJ05DRAFT_503633 [Pseudovirgaria hyperparasitica]